MPHWLHSFCNRIPVPGIEQEDEISEQPNASIIEFARHGGRAADGVEVREREFCIVKAGEVLPVEPKAFRVLVFLLRNPDRLITKDELLDAVWNDCAVSENSLTRSIALLGRLLGDDTHDPRYIATVPTLG